MPRINPAQIKIARSKHPLLAHLLRTCRELEHAQNELRWLKEQVEKQFVYSREWRQLNKLTSDLGRANRENKLLKKLCVERGRGKPLQYILGTEFFGDLELRCKPGVLIPRPESADIIKALANRMLRHSLPEHVRILDLCAGSGCMSLLLSHELLNSLPKSHKLTTLGVDVSPKAVRLARENSRVLELVNERSVIYYSRADVLGGEAHGQSHFSSGSKAPPLGDLLKTPGLPASWDIVISNPPYISYDEMFRDTARSVRNFEPHVALTPGPVKNVGSEQHPADIFYIPILRAAGAAGAKVVLMEVASTAQALRVSGLVADQVGGGWEGVEVWRDGIGEVRSPEIEAYETDELRYVQFKGPKAAKGRAVICWRGEGSKWISQF